MSMLFGLAVTASAETDNEGRLKTNPQAIRHKPLARTRRRQRAPIFSEVLKWCARQDSNL